MSFILGCWQYRNDFLLNLRLKEMYTAIQDLPHENRNFCIHAEMGMGHVLTYNTPESIHESFPIYLPERQILFTAQGRIDNRKTLAGLLELEFGNQYPDGFYILQSYLKWGKKCIDHLQGDWSFAAFDYKEQELFIARDPMGYTSVYYQLDCSGFYFSSSIKALIDLKNYSPRHNEEHFIRKLALWDDDLKASESTFYANIRSLPAAHTLQVKGTIVTLKKYWDPQHIPLKVYKKKQDYADEMLHIFSSSVKERLRSYKPVAAMLSGGLDSSAISYIAAEILRSKNISLTTISHIPLFIEEMQNDHESRFRILNETPFIEEIARASGNIHPIFLNSRDYSVARGMSDIIDVCNMPIHAAGNAYWIMDIFQNIAQKKFGSLLTGEGGNGNISFSGLDYLLPFSLSSLTLHPFEFFKNQVVKPIAKFHFNKWLIKRKNVNGSLKKYISNIFLRQSILEKYSIFDDIEDNQTEFYQPVRDIKDLKYNFIKSYEPRSLMGAACGQYFGFELRDPCTDINVMEYFFSIPNKVFFDHHYNNRMLVKRMMHGRIPNKVLFEKKKGLQNADIAYRVKAQVSELSALVEQIKQSPIANEYIDTQKLATTWNVYSKEQYVQPYQIQRLLKALQFALFLHKNFD